MTAKELKNNLQYLGQERNLRKLCLERNLISVDKLATMSGFEVCDIVARHYEILGYRDGGETIMLVEKANWDAVCSLIGILKR